MELEGSLLCPLAPILSQMNPVHAFLTYSFRAHFTVCTCAYAHRVVCFPQVLFIVKYYEKNTAFRELYRFPCSYKRMGRHLLSCPTGRSVLVTGPVTDDFRHADLWALLAFALELRKITTKFRTIFFAPIFRYWVSPEKQASNFTAELTCCVNTWMVRGVWTVI
jgi:hypothetical protein